MVEQDYPFNCPHCGVELSARIDVSGGKDQQFIQDCETCCRAIQITVELDGEEIRNFTAIPADE